MKNRNVIVLKDAADDLEAGRAFYEKVAAGLSNYFQDSLIADMEFLEFFAGIHVKKYDLFRMLARRFPFAIYYDITEDTVRIIAVLPLRRNPAWIDKTLHGRRNI